MECTPDFYKKFRSMVTNFATFLRRKNIKKALNAHKNLEKTGKCFENCQARPASLIPHHAMDNLPLNVFQIGPLVLDLLPQPPKLLLQGVDLLVDGFDFGGAG